jgi:hypothetical protein
MLRGSLLALALAACTHSPGEPDATDDAVVRLADFAGGDGLDLESPVARIAGAQPCGAADQQDTRLVYDGEPNVHFSAFWRCTERGTIEQLQAAFLSVAPGTFDFTIPDGVWEYSLLFPMLRLTNGVTIRAVSPGIAAFDIDLAGAHILAERNDDLVGFEWDGPVRVTLPFRY